MSAFSIYLKHYKISFALATTFSTVKPKSLNNSFAGADSPKLFIPTILPSKPTYLYQKSDNCASIATRLVTAVGHTASRYAASCLSNTLVLGIETTRTFLPSASSTSAALTANSTSEPVAMKIKSGVPEQSFKI